MKWLLRGHDGNAGQMLSKKSRRPFSEGSNTILFSASITLTLPGNVFRNTDAFSKLLSLGVKHFNTHNDQCHLNCIQRCECCASYGDHAK